MDVFLTNSATKKKQKFTPQEQGRVSMYLCGPTVYDDAHLGHARSAIFFDLLYRLFLALDLKVVYARNVTDIDDKIIAKMQESKKSLQEITQHYLQTYETQMKALNILPPSISPKATQNIAAMQELISLLLQKGFAYKASNGDVYFDSTKDKNYGKLSFKTQDDVQTRLAKTHKKNEKDFVLWKLETDQTKPFFNSNFGNGRPGWHTECTAMIKAHLDKGGEFLCDIHAGGSDLFFPHHENEDSQCRCAFDRKLANFWLHNGFVTINGEKMSKSLNNSFFVKDALKENHPEALRFYLLQTHYKNDFNFNTQDLQVATKRLEKIYRLILRIYGINGTKTNSEFRQELLKALSDDLNISVALSVIDAFIKQANDDLDKEPKNKALKQKIANAIFDIQEILGLGLSDAFEFFQFGISEKQKQEIQDLLVLRQKHKANKDFKSADEIRIRLNDMGISIMDTPSKTLWQRS